MRSAIYCDEERDELLYEQRRIDDRDRRVEIWHQVQEMMRDAYTHIFFNRANWTIGIRDTVHNVCGQISPADGTELFCNNQGRAQLHQVWLGLELPLWWKRCLRAATLAGRGRRLAK